MKFVNSFWSIRPSLDVSNLKQRKTIELGEKIFFFQKIETNKSKAIERRSFNAPRPTGMTRRRNSSKVMKPSLLSSKTRNENLHKENIFRHEKIFYSQLDEISDFSFRENFLNEFRKTFLVQPTSRAISDESLERNQTEISIKPIGIKSNFVPISNF